jgi:hypothetical protein
MKCAKRDYVSVARSGGIWHGTVLKGASSPSSSQGPVSSDDSSAGDRKEWNHLLLHRTSQRRVFEELEGWY